MRARVERPSPATEAARQEYDRLAGQYDQRWRAYVDGTLDAVLEAIEVDGSERLLDISCGTGSLAQKLMGRWPRLDVTGVDLSRAMLHQAMVKDQDRQVRWIHAEASSLPFADATFDYIVCANSFHYYPAPQQSLMEMRRLLRPGGTLVLLDWCDDYWACKLCSCWLRWTDPAFHRTYPLSACRSMLGQADLEVVAEERFRLNWLWGLMRLICRRPAG